MIKNFIVKIKNFIQFIKNEHEKEVYRPRYKLIEIIEKNDEYVVVLKLVNKSITLNMKPEEILANDELVDHFSPKDIRTLTYLGYLGINGPKYKILAKQLSENDKVSFFLKKKGNDKIIIKTAEQVLHETDIVYGLNPEDAKTVGYIAGSESVVREQNQKENLLKSEQNKITS